MNSIALKKAVWKVAPNFLHRWIRLCYFTIRLAPNSFYDFLRYLRYSGMNRSMHYRGEQAARIVMAYHQIEKGLSFEQPRPGFGREVVERVLAAVTPFVQRFGFVPPATTAIGVLEQYVAFNERAGADVEWLKPRLAPLKQCAQSALGMSCSEGGVVELTRAQIDAARKGGFAEFFSSRYSVRHFTNGEIPDDCIESAVRLAQKTPSVCNRQAWRVHVFSSAADRSQLLALQQGSRGFGEKASRILVVTSDLSSFVSPGERFQSWIDGGMFCMSLCLAVHEQGYGSCCLNWSKERADDRALHALTGIPFQEQVIMLIAVGTVPESFNVAYSARRPLDEVLVLH